MLAVSPISEILLLKVGVSTAPITVPMPGDKEPVVRIKLVILELGLATNERDCECLITRGIRVWKR